MKFQYDLVRLDEETYDVHIVVPADAPPACQALNGNRIATIIEINNPNPVMQLHKPLGVNGVRQILNTVAAYKVMSSLNFSPESGTLPS